MSCRKRFTSLQAGACCHKARPTHVLRSPAMRSLTFEPGGFGTLLRSGLRFREKLNWEGDCDEVVAGRDPSTCCKGWAGGPCDAWRGSSAI